MIAPYRVGKAGEPSGQGPFVPTSRRRRSSGRGAGCIDERDETSQLVLVVENRGPFVAVSRDVPGHGRFQVVGYPKNVLAEDVLQLFEAAVERLLPRRGALQPVCGADVEHQIAVDIADQVSSSRPDASSCACLGPPPLPPT
jgi:hypothetical protein